MRYIPNTPILVVLGFCVSFALSGSVGDDAPARIRDLFEKEYQSYLEAKNEELSQTYRTTLGPRMGEHLGNIIRLGPIAVPYLMEKVEEQPRGEEDAFLTLPLSMLTMKRFELSEWPIESLRDSREKVRMYVNWWKTSKRETAEKFFKLCSEWRSLKQHNKQEDAQTKLVAIRHLGYAVLPLLIDRIRDGEEELTPVVSKLSGGKVDPNASIEQCVSWWERDKEQWLVPFPNKRPAANAGKDQQVVSGATVLLDGSGSTDEDKDKLTYQWKQTAGPTVELSDAKVVQPSFAAPKVDKETALVFELVVNDGSPKKQVHPACQSGQSEPDSVTITVRP